MRPVLQTETELGKGNCLAACFASLLELPIEEVPNFRLALDVWAAVQGWLSLRGLCAVRVRAGSFSTWSLPAVHAIATGTSPRNPSVAHAVVARLEGDDLAIVHDPHPQGGGLAGEVEWVTFLAALHHRPPR